jgi:hypothetical protein
MKKTSNTLEENIYAKKSEKGVIQNIQRTLKAQQ